MYHTLNQATFHFVNQMRLFGDDSLISSAHQHVALVVSEFTPLTYLQDGRKLLSEDEDLWVRPQNLS